MKPAREIYRKEHRGITIEVSRHYDSESKSIWCFYLLLSVEMFPKEFHQDLWQPYEITDFGTPMQPYAECLRNLDWHSGMTYYEKTSAHDFPFRCVKAGCDYNHLWDEGQTYSAEELLMDAERCVDSLYESFPGLKTNSELWKEYRGNWAAKVAKAAESQKVTLE